MSNNNIRRISQIAALSVHVPVRKVYYFIPIVSLPTTPNSIPHSTVLSCLSCASPVGLNPHWSDIPWRPYLSSQLYIMKVDPSKRLIQPMTSVIHITSLRSRWIWIPWTKSRVAERVHPSPIPITLELFCVWTTMIPATNSVVKAKLAYGWTCCEFKAHK